MNIQEYKEYQIIKVIKTKIKTLKCKLTKENKTIPLFYANTLITEAKIKELEEIKRKIEYILQPFTKIEELRNCFKKQNNLEKKQNKLVAERLIRGINAKISKKSGTI